MPWDRSQMAAARRAAKSGNRFSRLRGEQLKMEAI